jgi:hypothetical protein
MKGMRVDELRGFKLQASSRTRRDRLIQSAQVPPPAKHFVFSHLSSLRRNSRSPHILHPSLTSNARYACPEKRGLGNNDEAHRPDFRPVGVEIDVGDFNREWTWVSGEFAP